MTASTSTDTHSDARLERVLWLLFGAGALVAAWAAIAAGQPDYMLPGPLTVWHALVDILSTQQLWVDLSFTVGRALLGLVCAIAGGVLLGSAMGVWRRVEWFFEPFISFLISVPAIVFVIVAMVWFGSNAILVVFVVGVVSLPLIAMSTMQAIKGIDYELVEMALVFRLSRYAIVRKVIFPMVAPPVLAAVAVSLGQSIRVSVMAELIAISSGIGGAIRQAQINIETPDVFAYAIVMAALAFVLEVLLLRPLRKKLESYRTAS